MTVGRRVTVRDRYGNAGWWLLGLSLFLLFVFAQLPASWILARFAPQQRVLSDIQGNLWQGQARFKLGQSASTPLTGMLNWKLQPWRLLWLEGAWRCRVETGVTRLNGIAAVGRKRWQLRDWQGRVDSSTLAAATPLQWPASQIQVQSVSLRRRADSGFDEVSGQLAWTGGPLGYPFQGRIEQANLPPLTGRLSGDQDGKRLQLALTNPARERMGDFYWSTDQFIEARLPQRLMLTVRGYQGQAGLDTDVITTRMPLAALGQNP